MLVVFCDNSMTEIPQRHFRQISGSGREIFGEAIAKTRASRARPEP